MQSTLGYKSSKSGQIHKYIKSLHIKTNYLHRMQTNLQAIFHEG